jgi:hypothetical protein
MKYICKKRLLFRCRHAVVIVQILNLTNQQGRKLPRDVGVWHPSPSLLDLSRRVYPHNFVGQILEKKLIYI